MKKISPNIYYILHIIFMYGIPLILFGGIIPYTHGELGVGLTKMGCVAVFIAGVIISAKIKDRIKDAPRSLSRGIKLMIFPIAWFIIIAVVLREILELVTSIVGYWDKCLIFVLIGAAFYILYEAASEEKK